MSYLGELVRDNLVYTVNGKKYKKVTALEKIKEGALMSWMDGPLIPITNNDGETIGSCPREYLPQRTFYNLI